VSERDGRERDGRGGLEEKAGDGERMSRGGRGPE